MANDEQFSIQWINHQNTLTSMLATLLKNGTFVDCTLAAEGKFLKVHKFVLSACSPYFALLLSQQYDKHPIIILKDIKFQELRALVDYMYRGEAKVPRSQLNAVLQAGISLQITGFSVTNSDLSESSRETTQKQPELVFSKSGSTIEHKRSANKYPTSTATESDASMSREGSNNPTSSKKKKLQLRSVQANNMDNNGQLSNSSSQSMLQQPSIPTISTPTSSASYLSQNTSATPAANALQQICYFVYNKAAIKATKEKKDSEKKQTKDDGKNDIAHSAQLHKPEMNISHTKENERSIHSIQTEQNRQDDTIEDLTNDEENVMDLSSEDEYLDEEHLDEAGPSQGFEGSSQFYMHRQIGQNQNEEAGEQRRHHQGFTIKPRIGKSQSGTEVIFHNGFSYLKGTSDSEFTYWTCGKEDHGCRARVVTTLVKGTVMMKTLNLDHNHK